MLFLYFSSCSSWRIILQVSSAFPRRSSAACRQPGAAVLLQANMWTLGQVVGSEGSSEANKWLWGDVSQTLLMDCHTSLLLSSEPTSALHISLFIEAQRTADPTLSPTPGLAWVSFTGWLSCHDPIIAHPECPFTVHAVCLTCKSVSSCVFYNKFFHLLHLKCFIVCIKHHKHSMSNVK